MKTFTPLLIAGICGLLLGLAVDAQSQALTADYQFQNSRSSSVAGAPALTDLIRPGQTCPAYCNAFATETVQGQSTTVLTFPYDNGLSLSPTTSVLTNNGVYSIGVLVRFTDLDSQYTRIIEFKNGTNDRGLYFYNHQLVFYSYGIYGPTIVAENQYAFVVLTRDGAGMITAYVNGLQQFTINDSANQYGVIDGNNVLRFFQDNLTGSSGEDSAGAVSRIRIWNGVLSAGQVATLNGGILYAANGASNNSNCHLFILNPGDGSVVQDIGPIGFAVTGLAFDPNTGVLYGATGGFNPSPPKRSLITIDPTTGTGTLVGAEGSGGPLADITFTSDETLYGWGEGSDDLYTVNKTTGFATKVAESNFNSAGSGIAANSADILYFGGNHPNGRLATVDRFTGQVTLGPPFSGAPLPNAELNAFAFNFADVLYASNGGECDGSSCSGYLVIINTTTGVVTNHGQTINNLDAIAFLPSCDTNPPTITAASGVTRKQGAATSNSQIATVSDNEDPPASLTVTINGSASATVNGVTVSNIAVDNSGKVTANVVASCSAFAASFTLRVTDSCGNYAQAILAVSVITDNPPVITTPGIVDAIAQKKKVNGQFGAYVYFNVSAVDPEDGPITATATPPSGSFFPVGITTVTVTATDSCGNTATASFGVDVAKKKKRHAPSL